MNEIEHFKNYLRGRKEWFNDKFKLVLKDDEKNYVFERRVKQAYRDCNIILRRIELLENKHPEGLSPEMTEEIGVLYRNFRFETIPKLYNLIEIIGH